MFTELNIQNFKSLENVSLKLQRVNLLIGPNNSGKSNLLKAIEFPFGINARYETVGESLFTSPEIFERLLHKQTTNQRISIEIKGENLITKGWEVNFKMDWFGGSNFHPVLQMFVLEESKLSNPLIGLDALGFMHTHLYGSLASHSPNPAIFSQPAETAIITELSRDCSNLIGFLFNIREYHPQNFRQIEHELKRCVGDFSYIRLPLKKIEDNRTGLELIFMNEKGDNYRADEVSEGVLYFLALLCIVLQPNPPKLILLEEPERGIHPRRISEVMQFIFDLAQEKDVQIILTSHSPEVLDEFKDRTNAVFVFDKDERGATQIKNLQTDIIDVEDQQRIQGNLPPIRFTDGLGEFWKVGFLGGVPL